MRAARDLRDFDEVFTGPLHGFAGADDYYARSSAKAAAGPHPHSGPGAERAQRSVPARVGAAAAGRGRPVRDALAAGARRPRRLCRRALARAPRRPCRAVSPAGSPTTSSAVGAQNRAHGRDRRRRAQEVAQRAALLRLARPRRARRLVHARRPHPGRRPVPARQGQPHRSREAARVHRPQLRVRRAAARGSSRTARSASTSSSRRRRGSGACSPTRRRASSSPATPGCRRCRDETFVDEAGRLFLASDLGLGIVHTLDMNVAGDAGRARRLEAARTRASTRWSSASRYRLSPGRRPARAGRLKKPARGRLDQRERRGLLRRVHHVGDDGLDVGVAGARPALGRHRALALDRARGQGVDALARCAAPSRPCRRPWARRRCRARGRSRRSGRRARAPRSRGRRGVAVAAAALRRPASSGLRSALAHRR